MPLPDLSPARVARRLILLVALLVAAGAGAQDPEPLPRFQIELVVFENLGDPPTTEAPPVELPEPPVLAPGEILIGDQASTRSEPGSSRDPVFFRLAPTLSLDNIASSLQRRQDYRVLFHDAWIQEGFEGDLARPVDAGLLEQMPSASRSGRRARSSSGDALSGTVTFVRGRYLHLDLDLRLGDGTGRQLKERRRVRLGQPHYFDAPKLGVIATVTRIENADPGAAAVGGTQGLDQS
jgi:hypothetical protein